MRRILLAVASATELPAYLTDKAARLASAFDAELEVFHCAYDPAIPYPGREDRSTAQDDARLLVEARRRELEAIAARARENTRRVRASVQWGYPAHEAIVRQVLRYKPDLLIVQATRSEHPAAPFLTYSDFKLIETCPCPVLVVKTARPYDHVRLVAAVDPQHAHHKPAALDDAILDIASTVSRALAGELRIFHARTPWARAAQVVREFEMTPEPADGDARAAYIERVARHVEQLARRHGVADEHVHIVEGNPVSSLPKFARGGSADIVVLGAVSRSLVERILIGHTAEQLLDAIDCDLLIVKPPGFRSPVPEEHES